jgi:hypothetical protein
MSLPSKNSNLAMFAAIAVSTMLLSAVTKADANPYMQGDLRIAEKDTSSTVKKTTTVKPAAVNAKKKIKAVPGGAMGQSGKEAFVKEGGPIFVKSGKPGDMNQKLQTQPGAKSLPSAVDVEKKIKSSTDN